MAITNIGRPQRRQPLEFPFRSGGIHQAASLQSGSAISSRSYQEGTRICALRGLNQTAIQLRAKKFGSSFQPFGKSAKSRYFSNGRFLAAVGGYDLRHLLEAHTRPINGMKSSSPSTMAFPTPRTPTKTSQSCFSGLLQWAWRVLAGADCLLRCECGIENLPPPELTESGCDYVVECGRLDRGLAMRG